MVRILLIDRQKIIRERLKVLLSESNIKFVTAVDSIYAAGSLIE